MMFDKDLFFSLCEKYNVELSDSATTPMIKDENGVHSLTRENISKIFAPCQTLFEYSERKLDTNITKNTYYLQKDYAIAC